MFVTDLITVQKMKTWYKCYPEQTCLHVCHAGTVDDKELKDGLSIIINYSKYLVVSGTSNQILIHFNIIFPYMSTAKSLLPSNLRTCYHAALYIR
jgi:hypothetical protein